MNAPAEASALGAAARVRLRRSANRARIRSAARGGRASLALSFPRRSLTRIRPTVPPSNHSSVAPTAAPGRPARSLVTTRPPIASRSDPPVGYRCTAQTRIMTESQAAWGGRRAPATTPPVLRTRSRQSESSFPRQANDGVLGWRSTSTRPAVVPRRRTGRGDPLRGVRPLRRRLQARYRGLRPPPPGVDRPRVTRRLNDAARHCATCRAVGLVEFGPVGWRVVRAMPPAGSALSSSAPRAARPPASIPYTRRSAQERSRQRGPSAPAASRETQPAGSAWSRTSPQGARQPRSARRIAHMNARARRPPTPAATRRATRRRVALASPATAAWGSAPRRSPCLRACRRPRPHAIAHPTSAAH